MDIFFKHSFLKYEPSLFLSFSQHNDYKWKSVDGMLGIRTRDRRMVGTDESTELWWPHSIALFGQHLALQTSSYSSAQCLRLHSGRSGDMGQMAPVRRRQGFEALREQAGLHEGGEAVLAQMVFLQVRLCNSK